MKKTSKLVKEQKSDESNKPLRVVFPDKATMAFWQLTAEDPNECASRIARFSRAMGREGVTKPTRSSDSQWRGLLREADRRRAEPRGKLLAMPARHEVGLTSHSQPQPRKISLPNGGNNEGTERPGKKRR